MVNQLFEALSALPQVEAIALGGSRSGTHFDEKSDYDIYLYCTGPVPEENRREILSRFCSYVEYGNHFWELEDNGTLNNGIDFDLLYRNLDEFAEGVADVVERGNAHNGYTTCMWHNLLTCKIIYDETGRLAAAQQRFSVPYPAVLKKNIIERNMKLLTCTMPAYDAQIKKALNRNDWFSVNHRVSAFLESYFDIIFALNEKTHPGEKRLISLCKETCPILPANFEENLLELFSCMFTDGRKTLAVLERIVAEVKKLI